MPARGLYDLIENIKITYKTLDPEIQKEKNHTTYMWMDKGAYTSADIKEDIEGLNVENYVKNSVEVDLCETTYMNKVGNIYVK